MPDAGVPAGASGPTTPGAPGFGTPTSGPQSWPPAPHDPSTPPRPGTAGPTGERHPQARPGGDGDQRPALSPAAVKVARLAGTFGVLVLASVLVATLPLPWKVASPVFAILAVVWGARAWVLAVRTRVRSGLPVMLGIGVVVACGWFLVGLALLAFWGPQKANQECLSRALTVSARQECAQQLQQDLHQRSDQLQRGTRTTP